MNGRMLPSSRSMATKKRKEKRKNEDSERPAVNIMLMRQAPLVGRAGGLSEGQGASEGVRKTKRGRR